MVDLSTPIGTELVSEAKIVGPTTKVASIIDHVGKNGVLLVKDNRGDLLLIDSRSLERDMQRAEITSGYAVGKLARKVPTVDSNSSIIDIIRSMQASRSKALPYIHKGRARGVVTRETILKALLSTKALKRLRVSDIMTSNPITIEKDANLSRAVALMNKHGVNRLIINNPNGASLVTRHDISLSGPHIKERLPEMRTARHPISRIPIEEVAVDEPVYIESGKSADAAVRLMVLNNISSVMVRDKSKTVGLVTVYDVFESLLSSGSEENNVFITGFDKRTLDYKPYIEQYAKDFMERMSKLKRVNVESLSIRFKWLKDNKYEVYVRASVRGEGMLHIYLSGFYLERTIEGALARLKEVILKGKDKRTM